MTKVKAQELLEQGGWFEVLVQLSLLFLAVYP